MSPPEKLDGIAIVDTSIRQPVFITMLMLLTVVIGALAYSSLPVNLLPDIDIPTVAVIMTYPGAGAESDASIECHLACRKLSTPTDHCAP